MRGLVFAQSLNKEARHDATGAFIPGAKQFTKTHGIGQPVWLDDKNDKKKMINAIAAARDIDVIAYFGHGVRSGLPSAEIWWKDIGDLSDAIRAAAAPGCRIILYACTSGQVGCFGNQLAKRLDNKYTVWGHTCVGHSFTNPYVTRFPFEGDTSPYLVDPNGPLWQAWHRLIKGKSDIWARYAFMTKETVETEIQTGKPQAIVQPRSYLIDI